MINRIYAISIKITLIFNKLIYDKIQRASSPAPSDSSTLSTLSVLSLQRKINNKSSALLHGKNKTLIAKKKSKSNGIAKINKMVSKMNR